MKICTYDLETLEVFTCCIKDFDTGKKRQFVIYDDINELHVFVKFLRSLIKNGYYVIGFNNVSFDNQILEYILDCYDNWMERALTCQEIVKEIQLYANYIITLPQEQKFKVLVPEWKFRIKAIDLFKQKHYDGKQKGGVMGVSLKWIQFTMRYPNIEEMPVAHDAHITKEMIPDILKYNWNDTDSTEEFFKKIKFETDLREDLTNTYNINLLNASEPKMARDIFGKFLCEEMRIKYAELKQLRTHRKVIPVKDILFPYIEFKTETLNNLLNNLRATTLRPQDEYERVFKIHNTSITFGLGGLHSSNENYPKVVTKQKGYLIKSCDVKSMYPNLAIQNKLKPEHLGDSFLIVYERIYNSRAEIPKKDPRNYIFKIILNSAYGLSSEPNSYFYDVQFTRAICINGQLSLLMLAEDLFTQIPECKFVMLNTDGLEVIIPEEKEKLYKQICEKWEKKTKLILEHNEYSKMAIRDVNNYVAQDIQGKVKRKGAFAYSMDKEDNEMDYHKKPNFLVIPKALEAYFIYGKDFRTFIKEHDDIYDFFAAVKRNSDSELLFDYYDKDANKVLITKQQKVTRYYASDNGGKLYKHYISGKLKGRDVEILADYHVKCVNDLTNVNPQDIFDDLNYTFYIKTCERMIIEIEGNSSQLTLDL